MNFRVILLELRATEIGERIRQIRKDANVSQEKFAEIIESSTQTVSNIETGKVIPNIQTLVNIAYNYNYSLDLIVGIRR